MRHYNPYMSVQMRQMIIDSAHNAGLFGAPTLPTVVHSVDPSDSLIVQALDAHELGLAEREKEKAA